MLNKKIRDIIMNGTPEQRVYVCGKSFPAFAAYYFTEYFSYKSAPFHWDFYKDCHDLVSGKKQEVAWIAFRESAKRQPLDADILTPLGFRKMGELKLGDYVIGSDGKKTKIEFMSEIIDRPIYELKTEDGRKTECDGEHLWTVRKMTNVKEKYETIDVNTILERGLYYDRKPDYRTGKIYKEYKFALDTVSPIEFSEKEYVVEPYFLGVWLGDGTATSSSITNVDIEIDEYLEGYAKRLGLSLKINDHNGNRTQTLSITGKRGGSKDGSTLTEKLREIGVLNDKHIPEGYLLGSVSQRKALLEGLMDTDGTVSSGTASFTNTNERIVDGVISLVRSLGGRASKRAINPSCIYKNKRVFGKKAWKVSIMLDDYTPFRIKRKVENHKLSNHTFSRIVEINKLGNKLGRCIKVTNDDGLYVTDDYLLTHNTSVAKLFIIWCILYKKKSYINYDSYDKSNSEAALFDIAVALQKNKKILADFGQIYSTPKQKYGEKESKVKRMGNFITENKVKVEAFSTQEPIRGRLYGQQRPELIIFDDVESAKTKDSMPTILKIRDHINEARTGMAVKWSILYLGNYITEDGVIAYIMNLLKNRENAVVRNIPIIQDGKSTWPAKYVLTDVEAIEINKDDPENPVVSLEQKRRDLSDPVFETEMMNNPAKAGDNIFDRGIVDNKRKLCYEPIDDSAGFKTWAEYNPTHRYAIGADTAEGVGRDSCASVAIDFTTMPARVVGTYACNTISDDLFGHELIRQAKMFGKCLLAPELNNTGYGTIAVLKENYPEMKIYSHITKDKTTNEETSKLGWWTNAGTKSSMIMELKTAYEDGQLEIYDVDLVDEIRFYQRRNMRTTKKPGMTRHFDKLVALAIAWQMRDHARPARVPGRDAEVARIRAERRNEYF